MTVFPDGSSTIFPWDKFVDLTMFQFAHEYCKPNQLWGPFVWNHYLFHYVISGRGSMFPVDKNGNMREVPLVAGQGFLTMPGQVSSIRADGKEPWEYMWIEFDGIMAKEILLRAGLSEVNPVYISKNLEEQRTMVQHMKFIVTNAHNTSLVLMGHLYLFLDALSKSSSAYNPIYMSTIGSTHIRRAIIYVGENYMKNITVEDIARCCNIHRSYLSRIFKNTMGCSPLTYLIGIRIKKACELLMADEFSIGQISAMVGYQNQLNFSRAFKREMGMSPHQWKVNRANMQMSYNVNVNDKK